MGQSDIPLNDKGRRQAALLAERLSRLNNAACYSSDLSRAMETAQIVVQKNGLRPIPDPRLREIKFGMFEGTSSQDWASLYPAECESYRRDVLRNAPPGGENRLQLIGRAADFLTEISTSTVAENILIVTHGGTLAAFFNVLLAWDAGREPNEFHRLFQFDNCSLSLVSFRETRWRVLLANCLRHLEELEEGNPVQGS